MRVCDRMTASERGLVPHIAAAFLFLAVSTLLPTLLG